MAATHTSKRYGVSDAKIHAVTADTVSAYTFGTGIDVPGIKAITLDAATTTKELRGDNQLLDSIIALTGISGTISIAKDSLDITAAALGLTVTDTGTGDAEIATLTVLGTSRPQPLRLEAVAAESDLIGGDVVLVVKKLTMIPITGFAEEDYQTLSVPFTSTPTVFDNEWISTIYRETAAPLPVG